MLDVIDKTKTAAGARKLRGYLRALSSDINVIHARQEHISHMVINPNVAGLVAATLETLPDVGRSLSRLLSGRGTPRDMRHICDFLTELPNAKMLASKLDAGLSQRFADINTHDDLESELRSALADELPTFFRDGGVIRDGFDLALDNMRGLSHGARETIAGLQAKYATDTGIHTLKIKYNNILGYFIEGPSARADVMMAADSGFIHRQTMAGNIRFTTEQLINLDNDVRNAAEKASGIESEIVTNLIDKIRDISDSILATADILAELDTWYALSRCASEYNWVCPDITNDNAFDVIGGRHPVIEFALRKNGDAFVKNDCNLNVHPIALLTGPNMAGKSTYLRQNALIVVLAHLGSFVPATRATIGICDQLFSRVGASDNLAAGQSTFMVEMQETANILRRATNQSFIIFDEIGRGTATFDGMAIAQAVLEYMNGMRARTLFATHYHELTALVGEDKLQNVACLTIDVREHNNEIIFMHKIIGGVASRSYGIHVARMAGMPEAVVKRADAVLSELESRAPTTAVVVQPAPTPQQKTSRVSSPNANSTQLNLFG